MYLTAGSLICRRYFLDHVRSIRGAPAAAARGLDDDDLAVAERQARLARHLLDYSIGVQSGVAAGLAVGAAMQPVRGEAPALALQRHPRGVVEDADRPDEAVAAAVLAGAGGALAQFVALDPERIGDLQRLDRRVHRIGHVALDAVVARPHRPAALAAADRLDIAVGPPPRDFGARVVAADRDRVHRALARRRHPVPRGM